MRALYRDGTIVSARNGGGQQTARMLPPASVVLSGGRALCRLLIGAVGQIKAISNRALSSIIPDSLFSYCPPECGRPHISLAGRGPCGRPHPAIVEGQIEFLVCPQNADGHKTAPCNVQRS